MPITTRSHREDSTGEVSVSVFTDNFGRHHATVLDPLDVAHARRVANRSIREFDGTIDRSYRIRLDIVSIGLMADGFTVRIEFVEAD